MKSRHQQRPWQRIRLQCSLILVSMTVILLGLPLISASRQLPITDPAAAILNQAQSTRSLLGDVTVINSETSQSRIGRKLQQAAGQGTLLTTGLTLPRGLVYIPTLNQYWISDGALGVTKLTFGANTNPPPAGRRDASTPAGMAFYPFTRADGTKAAHLFVADAGSKSNNVFRYVVTQAGITLDRTFVVAPTALGTGNKAKAGRAVAVAILPNKAGGKDLYVGYIKTGQIMRVVSVDKVTTTGTFVAEAAGSSVDAGISSLLAYKGDLLLAEDGGVVSKISDPSGVNGPKCNGACGAVAVGPSPCASPGGLATDPTATFAYCGEMPLVTADSRVFRFTPGQAPVLYSSAVAPGTVKYQMISALAVDENGDLLVAFDPEAVTDAPGAAQLVRVKAYTPGGAVGGGGGTGGTVGGTGTATHFAWGITAPKGGVVWMPKTDATGKELIGQGAYWSSDHAQGFCRIDVFKKAAPAAAGNAVAGEKAATNWEVCGPVDVGSPGQAAYDPKPVMKLDGAGNPTAVAWNPCWHYVYVPNNAVKSVFIYRLTYDACNMVLVEDPNVPGQIGVALPSLGDVKTLKPNGLALHPVHGLFVSTLTDKLIKRIINPSASTRVQSVEDVAETGDGRGANGSMGFIDNLLYVAGNRGAQFFDASKCPIKNADGTTSACGMGTVPAPNGVFVAGVAADATAKRVFFSDSPGGAAATIYQYDARFDKYTAFKAGSVPIAKAVGVLVCGTQCNAAGVCAPATIPATGGPGSCTVGAEATVYVKGGILPAADVTSYVTIGTMNDGSLANRPWDSDYLGPLPTAPGDLAVDFAFVFGMSVRSDGVLAIAEDKSAGERSGRGTLWLVKTR